MRRRTRPVYEPPIYAFRVRMLGGGYAPRGCEKIWREIEVAGNQSLDILGEAIPEAFDFDDPHLWSFYLGARHGPRSIEYMAPTPFGMDTAKNAAHVKIRDLPLPAPAAKKEFHYLFDFGDSWEFGVTLVRITESVESSVRFPKVVASAGDSPPQYPLMDDDEWDDASEEESGVVFS